MRWMCLVIGWLLLAAPVCAQTSVCDGPPIATVTVGQPFTLCWTAVTKDTAGPDTTITAEKLYRNGVLLTGKTIVADSEGLLKWHRTNHTETTPATIVVFSVVVVDDQMRESAPAPFLALSVLPVRTGPLAPAQTKVVR